ncbi:hypothetical protein O181_021619 [Austropuccinia psidii MF-1]|uniref:Holocytochrome c-type synthase n=1 Tax=Austropuccinia psidii MF-1 TaxID=1389203 RepID=A0A9Q3CB36_9BASI|nr:hypothetical protein [Austropuccinia psidii MF-1]
MWPFSSSSSSTSAEDPPASACPVDHGNRRIGSDVSGIQISQLHSGVSDPTRLPTDRTVSSIPRYRYNPDVKVDPAQSKAVDSSNALEGCPVKPTQPQRDDNQQNWVYPSPSQFYQALVRKNKNPSPNDMYTVVPIHNAVNERVWTEILKWEADYGRGSFDRWPRSGKSGPMLCSFRGRPDDLSPRAWIKVLSGYQAPFDRHDWEVIRPTEERMRYVIDFYPGKGSSNLDIGGTSTSPNLSFYLDVRPAIDNWEGLRMRMLRSWEEIRNSSNSTNPTH